MLRLTHGEIDLHRIDDPGPGPLDSRRQTGLPPPDSRVRSFGDDTSRR